MHGAGRLERTQDGNHVAGIDFHFRQYLHQISDRGLSGRDESGYLLLFYLDLTICQNRRAHAFSGAAYQNGLRGSVLRGNGNFQVTMRDGDRRDTHITTSHHGPGAFIDDDACAAVRIDLHVFYPR